MPSDVVAIAVTTGIGVSVFAGFLSGVCYVLAHGFTIKRSRKPALQWTCVVCGNYFHPASPDKTKIVICSQCEERVCKKRCSKRDYAKRDWICYNCLKRPSFLQNILNYLPSYKKNSTTDNNMGKNFDSCELKQEKECVRDFIEKLVSTIVGGSVDDASIVRTYKDKPYDALFGRHHRDLSDAITDLSSALQISMKNASFSEQSPSSAHTNLKYLIEKILREVARLPHLRQTVEIPASSEDRTYEELLATAILNKIIDKKENVNEQNDDWRELESASNSSFDEYIPSDSSHGSSKYVDRLSLTIHQRIEEIPSHGDIENTLYKKPKNQPNWYLQRRQFHGSNSPIPVPMLVPNPLTSAKVLIGDKEIDDTSDLSDANSDYDDSSLPLDHLTIDSTLTIEHKADISDEETSFDSGVREDKDDFNDKESFYYVGAKVDPHIDDENEGNVSISSSVSNAERDFEYLEKYSSLPKTGYFDDSRISRDVPDSETQTRENRSRTSSFEGSYSQREKEKWNHPVDMLYNPYSENNIRRRLHSNEKFGRDYYTKQASLPSGRLKSDEVNDTLWIGDDTSIYRAEPVEIEFDSSSTFQNTQIDVNIEHNVKDDDFNAIRDYDDNFNILDEPDKNVNDPIVYVTLNKKKPNEDVKITVNRKEVNDSEVQVIVNQKGVFHSDQEPKTPTIEISFVEDLPKKDTEDLPENKITKPVPIMRRTKITQTFNEAIIKETPVETPAVIVSRKSDNTLIRKIYSNPVVRNFALTTREQNPFIPAEKPPTPTSATTSVKIPKFNLPLKDTKNNTQILVSPKKFEPETVVERKEDIIEDKSAEIPATQHFSLEFSDSESIKEKSSVYDDDFNELKELRLVASRLGQFSKSFPNLTMFHPQNKSSTIPVKKLQEENVKNEESVRNEENTQVFVENFEKEDVQKNEVAAEQTFEKFVSVKNLKKLFEKRDTLTYKKDKPVHSLTARSISKEIKHQLSTSDLRSPGIYESTEVNYNVN